MDTLNRAVTIWQRRTSIQILNHAEEFTEVLLEVSAHGMTGHPAWQILLLLNFMYKSSFQLKHLMKNNGSFKQLNLFWVLFFFFWGGEGFLLFLHLLYHSNFFNQLTWHLQRYK